jgi:hypothetical protein
MSEPFSTMAAAAFQEALEQVERSLAGAGPVPASEVAEPEVIYAAAGSGGGLGDPRELGERAALLAVAEMAWSRHLGALLDSHQVQALLGVGTRQAVSDRARRGGLLALPTTSGRVYFPAFQFGPGGRPHPALPKVLAVFAQAEVGPWTVASWFRTPQALLDDTAPADWMGQGKDEERLLEAARRTAAKLAH